MKPARALFFGALTVGALDILDAFVFFWFRSGARPARILQGIAAGVLGPPAAVAGGLPTAALGLLLHFLNAFLIVSAFFLAARTWPFLVRRPVITGVAYGLVAYAVMNYLVVPLSGAGAGLANITIPATPVLVNGLLIHIFGVGLPTAFFARQASGRTRVGQ
jgi:hypothetical protein